MDECKSLVYGHFQKLTLTISYLPGGAANPMRFMMWAWAYTRPLHQLHLSRFGHTSPCPPV